jgi:peptidoglycan/LPS O-acetylase OafA/YrhL
MSKLNSRSSLLDVSRLVAAIGVVLFHISSGTNSLLNLGYLSVDYFFVLSGFVLAHKVVKVESFAELLTFTKYRAKRFIPNTVLSLALILILITGTWLFGTKDPVVWQNVNALSLISYLTFLSIFVPSAIALNYPIWTLSTEFIVNLLVAVTNIIFGGCKSKEFLYLIPSILFIFSSELDGKLNFLPVWWTPLIRTGSGFCLGYLLSFLASSKWTQSIKQITILISTSILLLVGETSIRIQIASMMIVLIFSRQKMKISKFERNYIVKNSGELSFMVYMIHIPLLNLIDITKLHFAFLNFNHLGLRATVYSVLIICGASYAIEFKNHFGRILRLNK